MEHLAGGFTMSHSPFYQLMELAGALAGPVREVPRTVNPPRDFLAAHIDFGRVRACEDLQAFVNATNVNTGTGKLWLRDELGAQRVMASCCLPTAFASVDVDGALYWGGSFPANPPLAPLVASRAAQDLLVVQILDERLAAPAGGARRGRRGSRRATRRYGCT